MMKRYVAVFVLLLTGTAYADDMSPSFGNEGQLPILASDIVAESVITGSARPKLIKCTILNCDPASFETEKLNKTSSSP